ncbi:MAG TPA: twin-arginine translocase TatA/TatE family subunit [Acidimicrobiales bacterium]|nr:twin-arginine translocase TatA/TatE family subunit [Acidimicrobiales bacterium]
MGTLGPAEILVILLVALIVLGPDRLPDAARKVGQFIGEVRRIGSGFQAEIRDAMNGPAPAATAAPPAPGAPPAPAPDTEVAPAPSPPPPARPDDAAGDLP